MALVVEPAFLTTADANDLIKLIRVHSARNSLLTGPKDYRTSSTAGLPADNPLVRYVERRIAAALQFDVSSAEGLFGSWYQIGEHYRVHHDAFYHGTPEYEQFIRLDAGNRVASAMIYLNTVAVGGETVFPALGVHIVPHAGTLVSWSNLLLNSEPDERMMHAAEPPATGDKFIVTLWFRQGRFK